MRWIHKKSLSKEAYLKLAETFDSFATRLRNAGTMPFHPAMFYFLVKF
jgi:hypothetical protein